MFDVSVIVPTHNRADMVCRNIAALARQTMPASRFEVIVVADGCEDQTAARLQSLDLSFRLRVVEQTQAGASKARNAGADLAEGTLLVFLDDDMYADAGLLEAHWQTQQARPTLLVGFFSTPVEHRSEELFAASANAWWDNRFRRLGQAGHRHTFRDVCTGNMSVSRSSFLETGGFDEEIGRWAGEDYEFAIRWLKRGERIGYCPTARSYHQDQPSVDKALKRAYDEGRGHVLIARRHPECFMALPLRIALDGQPWIRIKRWVKLSRRRANTIPKLVHPAIHLAITFRFRWLYSRLFGISRSARLWAGVLDETDGLGGLREMIQDIPYEPSVQDVEEIDISQLPLDLAKRVTELQPGSLALLAGTEPIAWIQNTPGSEPIAWSHVVRKLEYWLDAHGLRELPLPEENGRGSQTEPDNQ
ncbi:MAG: glycosyltransferase family 2 protein [Gammaproteobacteria bacterium]